MEIFQYRAEVHTFRMYSGPFSRKDRSIFFHKEVMSVMGNIGENIRDWFAVMRNDPAKKKKFITVCVSVGCAAFVLVGVGAYKLHSIESNRRSSSASGLITDQNGDGYNDAGGLIADIDFNTILGYDADGNPIYGTKGLVEGVSAYDMFGAPIKSSDLVATGTNADGSVIYGNYSAQKIARIRNIQNNTNPDIDWNSIVAYDADGNRIYGSLSHDSSIIGYDANGNPIPRDSAKVTGKTGSGLPIYDYSSRDVAKVTGATGANGKAGANDSAGVAGANGVNGNSGAAGVNGSNGSAGVAGANGVNGAAGANGSNGKDGVTKVTSVTGTSGKNGTNGKDGINASSADVAALKTNISTLQSQLSTIKQELASSKAETASVKAQNLKQQTTIDNYITKLSQIEKKISSSSSSSSGSSSGTNTLSASEIAELQKQLSSIMGDVNKMSGAASASDVSALKTTIASLQTQLNNVAGQGRASAAAAQTAAEKAQQSANEAKGIAEQNANSTAGIGDKVAANEKAAQDNAAAIAKANETAQANADAISKAGTTSDDRYKTLSEKIGSMGNVRYKYTVDDNGKATITFSPVKE